LLPPDVSLAKMDQIRFRLGLRPRPRWGSLQCSPTSLAGFKGPTSKGREGRGRGLLIRGGREGRGRRGTGGKRMEGGREMEGPTYKGRQVKGGEGKREREGPPGYYVPPDLGC